MRGLLVVVSVATAISVLLFGLTLAPDGIGWLDGLLAAMFAVLFGWIMSWFWVAALGTLRVWRLRRRPVSGSQRASPVTPALPKTAVVIPIHNEKAESVFARLCAMLESTQNTLIAGRLDFFILSDTTDADIWLCEEICWAETRRRFPDFPIYYRRRPNKFRKKSGNLTDFCQRWGKRYRYLIVLDADSVMDGPTMAELVQRMERSPRIGILQTPVLPALSQSFYARLQQFAASLYGPPVFAGLAQVFQESASFWGHNAIIRTQAFMQHCGLPGLSGRPPFGGPILSHDFVEAALIRRAGYEVRLAWDLLAGSYEQSPVSLAQAAARDRRWCQGNLQHTRLLFSRSLPWKSRGHFAIGILFYATSALWGPFVLLCAIAQSAAGGRNGASTLSAALLLAVVVFLFSAKLLGAALVLSDADKRSEYCGALRLTASMLIEIVVMALTAPILMISHLGSLLSVLSGASIEWSATDREETRSPWRDALRAHAAQSLIGAAIALAAWAVDPLIALWLVPIWFGLLLAVPLGAALASTRIGTRLARWGLLLAPTETRPPAVLEALLVSAHSALVPRATFSERFLRVIEDPCLNTLHRSLLEAVSTPLRPQRLIASLVRRVTRGGVSSLSEREAMAVLSDAWAMRALHEQSLEPAEEQFTTS